MLMVATFTVRNTILLFCPALNFIPERELLEKSCHDYVETQASLKETLGSPNLDEFLKMKKLLSWKWNPAQSFYGNPSKFGDPGVRKKVVDKRAAFADKYIIVRCVVTTKVIARIQQKEGYARFLLRPR